MSLNPIRTVRSGPEPEASLARPISKLVGLVKAKRLILERRNAEGLALPAMPASSVAVPHKEEK